MGGALASCTYLNDEKLKNELTAIHKKFGNTFVFPGYMHCEEKFLEHRKEQASCIEMLPGVVDKIIEVAEVPFGGVGSAVFKKFICIVFQSTESINEALIFLKVDRAIAESCHSFVRSDFEAIQRQMELSLTEQESGKQTAIAIADNECYKLLVKFNDPKSYLRKQPLAYGPFLVSFVPTYISVLLARYVQDKGRKEDVRKNLTTLFNVVGWFRNETLLLRLKMVSYGSLVPVSMNPPYKLTDDYVGKVIYRDMYVNVVQQIYDYYTKELNRFYDDYFDPSLKAIEKARARVL